MPVSVQFQANWSDSEMLYRAQHGDSRALGMLPRRLGGLEGLSGADAPDGPLGSAARRACIRAGRRDPESIEEVVAQVYAQVIDPELARYDPKRGTVGAYLYGLALNAVKGLRKSHSAHWPRDLAQSDQGMSIDEWDVVCWAFRTAPIAVRRAFARLRGGRTLDEAATAVGMNRRSLKRAIDEHLDGCQRILRQSA